MGWVVPPSQLGLRQPQPTSDLLMESAQGLRQLLLQREQMKRQDEDRAYRRQRDSLSDKAAQRARTQENIGKVMSLLDDSPEKARAYAQQLGLQLIGGNIVDRRRPNPFTEQPTSPIPMDVPAPMELIPPMGAEKAPPSPLSPGELTLSPISFETPAEDAPKAKRPADFRNPAAGEVREVMPGEAQHQATARHISPPTVRGWYQSSEQAEDADYVPIRSPYTISSGDQSVSYDPSKAESQLREKAFQRAERFREALSGTDVSADVQQAGQGLAALYGAHAGEDITKHGVGLIKQDLSMKGREALAQQLAETKAEAQRLKEEAAMRKLERSGEQRLMEIRARGEEQRKAKSAPKRSSGPLRMTGAQNLVPPKVAARVEKSVLNVLRQKDYKKVAMSEFIVDALVRDIQSGNPYQHSAALGQFATLAQSRINANRLTEQDFKIFAKHVGGVRAQLLNKIEAWKTGLMSPEMKPKFEAALKEWGKHLRSEVADIRNAVENAIDLDPTITDEQRKLLKNQWVGTYFSPPKEELAAYRNKVEELRASMGGGPARTSSSRAVSDSDEEFINKFDLEND